MGKIVVIAIGGNSLIKDNSHLEVSDQYEAICETVEHIVDIIEEGYDVVITHGNGPQVGSILLQNNATRDIIPPMPLGICVAESQGFIGYMIQQCISNALQKAEIKKKIATIITQVLIDENDPSLQNPTKPIGPYYTEDDAAQLLKDGYQITKQPRGWRIVVPSPDPKSIVEGEIIKKLLSENIIVIAAGGGGMPVIQKEGWGLDGIEAVVDKDLASERLAEEIHADLFMILTNVEKLYLYFNTEKQRPI